MNKREAREAFARLASRTGDELDLDRGALLIAAEEYPSLRIEDYMARLDQFATEARSRFAGHDHPLTSLLRLRDYLFVDLRFCGNQEEYFDVRNSFLNEVIEGRKGIPITLSVIFMEVARRLGLPLLGVGMPGHFIVRFETVEQVVFFDPFREGRELNEDDCREMVSNMYGETLAYHPSFLRAVSNRQILSRMLQNLKGIYTRLGERHKLLDAIERAVLLRPEDASEIRDRGLACFALGRFNRALGDLQEYLRRAPQAPDRSAIKEKLGDLRQRQAGLN